jgi:hypothetical protein
LCQADGEAVQSDDVFALIDAPALALRHACPRDVIEAAYDIR